MSAEANSFIPIHQYENAAKVVYPNSLSELLEQYYSQRDSIERNKQHAQDIYRLISSEIARINRKTELQEQELSVCAKKDKYKN